MDGVGVGQEANAAGIFDTLEDYFSAVIPALNLIPTPIAWADQTVPVNAFDADGFRIGYGGGYFDRTLAALQPPPTTIGVGFDSARVADAHGEPHDRPMDWVVTESGARRCPFSPSEGRDLDR